MNTPKLSNTNIKTVDKINFLLNVLISKRKITRKGLIKKINPSCNNNDRGKKIIKSYHPKYISIINKVINKINRFALHAYKIRFIHPISNQKMELKAPFPNDISSILDAIL